MIVQAVLAVAVGVGVFLIFGQLWERLSTVIMLGLALVATLALVGVIHALLRHRDKLIMLLAFVVGLVLTLGPRLILGL